MLSMQGKKSDINSESYEKELKERILKKIKINDNGCWEWLSCSRNGYGVIRAKRRTYLVHRLTYELWKNIDPQTYFVCHKCDNPICCNPDHMFLGSQVENIGDAKNKKRMKQGENHYNRKLNEKQVLEIKKLLKYGLSFRKIGKLYGVSYSCIGSISLGKSWKTLKD